MHEDKNMEIDKEIVEEELEEVEENLDTEEKKESVKPVKKMKKHSIAKQLVEEAKALVDASENEIQDCKLLLADDLKEFDIAKQALKSGGLDAAQALIETLGHTIESIDEDEDFVLFDAKDDVAPITLKDVHSGRFTGLILSLLGGAATLGGLIYLATEKLGLTLDMSKVPSAETIEKILGWFGTQIGRPDDAINGGLMVGAAVLAVMAIIYWIRVGLKGGSNLRFAQKQIEETHEYISKKASCKEEMDKVDAHISDAIKVLKDYEIVLNEQAGKLKRILHFEGQKENSTEYHNQSLAEMKDTQNLIENITRFISTPMSEEGKLSGKSTLFLHSAKEALQKVLAKFS